LTHDKEVTFEEMDVNDLYCMNSGKLDFDFDPAILYSREEPWWIQLRRRVVSNIRPYGKDEGYQGVRVFFDSLTKDVPQPRGHLRIPDDSAFQSPLKSNRVTNQIVLQSYRTIEECPECERVKSIGVAVNMQSKCSSAKERSPESVF
jgi:hypothetical protein